MKKILIVMSVAAGLASCRPQNPDVPAVREFIRNNWHTTVQHWPALSLHGSHGGSNVP